MDDADRAKGIETAHREAALRRQQVQAAADNAGKPFIVDGYRACVDCLQPIAVARLQVRPHARRCVHCKTLKEKKERRY